MPAKSMKYFEDKLAREGGYYDMSNLPSKLHQTQSKGSAPMTPKPSRKGRCK